MSTDQTEDSQRYVARGVAHVTLPKVIEPVHVTFVLAPRFTMLAFTSAIEPLRVANQLTGQILFRWQTFSEDGQPVRCSNGVPVMPDGPLSAAQPQGHVLICGGVQPEVTMGATLGDWVRNQWRRGRTVGGLCTGAYALARAGILKGRRFTLHWENLSGFSETFPDLTPARQVFCLDDRIVTCAGGVAAADLMLKLIHDHYGAELSQEVMNMCLLTQRRDEADEQVTSLAARLGTRNEKLIKAVAFLEARIEEEFDLDACADHLGVSRRQIERLFNRYLGVTPVRYMNDLRLQHGRALLAETDLSVTEVAVACGYASSSHFSKSFRKKYGVSPYRFSHFRA
ncbi:MULTISPECIES: GlxA family transcriptional regulator [Gemmobacter]|jgi:transcriptional regulator GlxA family with amidase domain|uniref:AraC family transcriptional regulator with amidase-like domain n=1 Tax=Gemmobacter caeni TaxID=589035 RepID=A0A2T6BC50_9RHOB|nr:MULTISPECIES: GlxA family transcriptional regulator [Gemmobacter]PTX53612.1 AraC family transcriptional regulator with amidase-like domain [Gemmobacter caeni]TWJ05723.1 transcriptional regulator, AraC family with amidase-like domain [Gemmobacter caeni]